LKKVRETKEKTKKIISEQAEKIAKQAEEHEKFINKVWYFCVSFTIDSHFACGSELVHSHFCLLRGSVDYLGV